MATFKLPIENLPITIEYLESYKGDIIDKFLIEKMPFEEAVAAVNEADDAVYLTETNHNGLLRCQKEYNNFICYNLDKVNKEKTKNWQIGTLKPGKKKKIYIRKTYNIDMFFDKTITDNNDYVWVVLNEDDKTITIRGEANAKRNQKQSNGDEEGWSPYVMQDGWEYGQILKEQRELVLRF